MAHSRIVFGKMHQEIQSEQKICFPLDPMLRVRERKRRRFDALKHTAFEPPRLLGSCLIFGGMTHEPEVGFYRIYVLLKYQIKPKGHYYVERSN